MSTHIGIIGKSGSGKSTIAMGNKDLGIIGLKDLGCHIAVSHTSRPKRDGEIDGVDYHFVDNQTILDMKDRGELFNFHERFGVLYAMTLKEMNCASIVVGIFDHEGIDTLLSYDSSSFIVWVDIDEGIGLFEVDHPDDYFGKYMSARDLIFLREAKRVLAGKKND